MCRSCARTAVAIPGVGSRWAGLRVGLAASGDGDEDVACCGAVDRRGAVLGGEGQALVVRGQTYSAAGLNSRRTEVAHDVGVRLDLLADTADDCLLGAASRGLLQRDQWTVRGRIGLGRQLVQTGDGVAAWAGGGAAQQRGNAALDRVGHDVLPTARFAVALFPLHA